VNTEIKPIKTRGADLILSFMLVSIGFMSALTLKTQLINLVVDPNSNPTNYAFHRLKIHLCRKLGFFSTFSFNFLMMSVSVNSTFHELTNATSALPHRIKYIGASDALTANEQSLTVFSSSGATAELIR